MAVDLTTSALRSLVMLGSAGNPDAFAELVRRFQDMAVGYAYSVVRNRAVAEDVAQDAFIAAWQSLDQLREPEAFAGWFRRIVFKHCDRHTRGRREDATSNSEPPATREAELTNGDTDLVLRAAVDQLPPHQREVVVLFYYTDRSMQAIARFLDVPVSTVKSRLFDARAQLKQRFSDMVDDALPDAQRPSGSTRFHDKVMRIIQPDELKTDAPRFYGGFAGHDVWDMIVAALTGDVPALRRLLNKDPRLVDAEYFYTKPIHFAVREGHVEAVTVLLEAGSDPMHRPYGLDDLPTTARDRGHEAVAQLVEAARARRTGAPVQADHPIHRAAASGDMSALRTVLDADPTALTARDSEGRTAVDLATRHGRIEALKLLLDRGATVSSANAVADRFMPNVQAWPTQLRWATVGLLLGRGAAYTLTLAAGMGDMLRVRELLDADPALIRHQDPDGRRPLSAAAEGGHREIVRLLLDRGTDPNWDDGPNAPRGSALYFAARAGDLEMIQMLLDKGADPNADIESSGNAVYAAKDAQVRALLFRHGAKPLDPFSTAHQGDIDAVRRYLDETPPDKWDGAGLYTATVSTANWPLFNLLIERNVQPPKVLTLCHSYLWKTLEMTKVLLERGMMSPNLPDWQRATPLHKLTGNHNRRGPHPRQLELIALFLDHGADIEARDEEYQSTPLGWAARNGATAAAQLLIERGASVMMRDGPSWATPLEWAKRRGHQPLVELLRRHGATD